MKRPPIIYLIAGPNGAGKTTFATEFFPRYVGKVDFINADLIAQGLSPFRPERVAASAGRVVLQRISQLTRQKTTFAVETTLSGRTYAKILERMKAAGYRVHLYYLWVPNSSLTLQRIKERVRRGGHNIPPAVVRRRFGRSLRNLFHVYDCLCDYVLVLDNSGNEPRPIVERRRKHTMVSDPVLFEHIRREAEA